MTTRLLGISFSVSFALLPGGASVAHGAGDLVGSHSCTLSYERHPCKITARPDGGYDVEQVGRETFKGTLEARGEGFHLDGIYGFSDASTTHLQGDLKPEGDGVLRGRIMDGKTPLTVGIGPPEPPRPNTALSAFLSAMISREAVAARTKLPLRVTFDEHPKLSFVVEKVDDKAWSKISGIFGMIPEGSNISIKCNDLKRRCMLTALSGADVEFVFVKTSSGPKLARIEMPAEGD